MASIQSETDAQSSLKMSESSKKRLFFRGSVLLSMGLASMLTITGCSKGSDKKAEEAKTTQENAEALKSNESNLANKVCNDTQLIGSLKEAITTSISAQSKVFAAAHAQSSNVAMNNDNVDLLASNIVVDVQSVQADNEASTTSNGMASCQATISMKLSEEDISRADALYASANEPSLQQKLENAQITLNNGVIVDNQLRFVVDPNATTPVAQIISQPATLKAVADVVANSSIKSQIDAQAAARKAAAERKRQQQAAAEKKARQQAAARKKARQEAARKAAAKKQQEVANNYKAKPTDLAKPKQPTQTAEEKLNVKGAEQIEMVIVEEEGTY